MSDYLPFEIQVEIVQRLPVKSLFQFRSVSVQWKSLIDSSDFMAAYNVNVRHNIHEPQRLLVRYIDPVSNNQKFVSFIDDNNTFALQDFTSTVPELVKQHNGSPSVVGSSQGLLCLHGYRPEPRYPCYGMAVLWNPCIRKSVGIVVPELVETVIGFGVCPTTNDPTIVMFTHRTSMRMETLTDLPWEVAVFSLSAGTWRIPSGKPPYGKITVKWDQVTIDKFIYWRSFDGFPIGGIWTKNLILSYDMITEEIGAIELPDSLAHHRSVYLTISKVGESLAMLQYSRNTDKQVCDVWMMDRGGLFTKLFTVNTPNWKIRIHTPGFTKSGELMVSIQGDHETQAALVVYGSCSEHMKDVGIYGRFYSFVVGSYMETLLLHDQVDSRVYSNIS